jgi:hypothetical protein
VTGVQTCALPILINKRILRVKLDYAATETATIP